MTNDKQDMNQEEFEKTINEIAKTECQTCGKNEASIKSDAGQDVCQKCYDIIEAFNEEHDLYEDESERSFEELERLFDIKRCDPFESFESLIRKATSLFSLMSIYANNQIDVYYRDIALDRFEYLCQDSV